MTVVKLLAVITLLVVIGCFINMQYAINFIAHNGAKVYQHMLSQDDLQWTIPEDDRIPKSTPVELRKQQNKVLQNYLVQTRTTHKDQQFLGNVMQDGYHSALPPGNVWKNGMIALV